MWGQNIDHDLLASLKSINGSADRVVFITHIEAGFNNEANTGKVFLALAEPVSINKIKSRFEDLGAFEVNWRAFPSNDNNDAASSALCSVRQLAAKSNDAGYANGTCDEHLNRRTEEKLDAIKLQQKQHDAAELKEKSAAEAKLQHEELRGDVAQCTAAVVANGNKIDALGTSVKEGADTIANAVAANGKQMGACGVALEEIYDQVGENAGWLMRKNDGLEERYTEVATELAETKAKTETAKKSAAGKHGDDMRKLRKEMDDMVKAYGAVTAVLADVVAENSKLKRDKDADAKTIALMAQSNALMAQSITDLRHTLGLYECVEQLHALTERKRARYPSDSD